MTRDNGMDCEPSWQELKRQRDVSRRDYEVMNKLREGSESERDAAVEQVAYWRDRAVSAEEREQALTAHVEKSVSLNNEGFDNALNDVFDWQDWNKRMQSFLSETPTTSLARRDAEKQASAIDKWSATIIQLMEWVSAKHAEDPSWPPISLQMIRELCCDMDADAERLRNQSKDTQ